MGEEVAAWYINKVERGVLEHPSVARLRAICEVIGADFNEALRLGEYPGYSGQPDTVVPGFLRARLAHLSADELETLDRLWPAIEDLIRRATEEPAPLHRVAEPRAPYGR